MTRNLSDQDSVVNLLRQVASIILDRFLRPGWVLAFLGVIAIGINWSRITQAIAPWGISEYALTREYLALLFSLPLAILILGLVFIFKFSDAISTFLKNSKPSQLGPLGVAGTQTERSAESLIPTTATDSDKGTIGSKLLQDFTYLNLALVLNTKNALLWFYLQPSQSSTRENFMNTYGLPPQIINPILEKEVIVNVLLTSELLKLENGMLTVTDKGEKFLRFINFLPFR